MKTSYTRTKAVKEYHGNNIMCEVCWMPSTDIHHIDQDRSNDTEENFEALCRKHHTGDEGVHTIGVVKFCERFLLTETKKWKARYEHFKSKEKYRSDIGKTMEAGDGHTG